MISIMSTFEWQSHTPNSNPGECYIAFIPLICKSGNPGNPGSDKKQGLDAGIFSVSSAKSEIPHTRRVLRDSESRMIRLYPKPKPIGYILEIPINRHPKNYKIH